MNSLMQLVQGSAHHLPFLADGSIHAVITSPPYLGLRKYHGDQDIDWPEVSYSPVAGLPPVTVPAQRCALGEEAEPFAYIGHLILCLREWGRVLRDDGVVLVNLGDSYSRGGVRRANAYGTSGKEPVSYQVRDSSFQNPGDGYHTQDRHISHTSPGSVPTQAASPSAPTREHTAIETFRSPTSDLPPQVDRTSFAIQDRLPAQDHEGAPILASVASTPDESSLLLPGEYLPIPNRDAGPDAARSSPVSIQASEHKSIFYRGEIQTYDGAIQGQRFGTGYNEEIAGASVDHISDTVSDSSSYLYCNTLPHHIETAIPPKNLLLIPSRFALAAQADGWIVRSNIIWAKGVSFLPDYAGSAMPESVTDRPSRTHEDIFLLAKRERYFWDGYAVREKSLLPNDNRKARSAEGQKSLPTKQVNGIRPGSATYATRNQRSVWVINPRPFAAAAHFACWPETLVDPMIRAATSERGCCPACGAPWVRVVEKPDMTDRPKRSENAKTKAIDGKWMGASSAGQAYQEWRNANPDITTSWQASCTCSCIPTGTVCYDPAPCTVLDPFSGSATTGKVAVRLGRRYVGVDLAAAYLGDVTDARMGAGVQMELV